MGWNDVQGNENNTEKIPYTKFEAGNTVIRILDEEPYSFWSHWLQKQQTSVTCRGRDCPICNIIAQAKAANEKPPYNSSKRHAIRIWNYNTNQMEVMIQGKTFFSQLLTLHREIGDLRTYDVKVVRKGNGTDTTYTLLPSAPSEFAITEGITEVDMKEIFAAPTKEEMIMLAEGKTWKEINETEEVA